MRALLEYTYADNNLERREQYRVDHLRAGWESVERGELLLVGPSAKDPSKGC